MIPLSLQVPLSPLPTVIAFIHLAIKFDFVPYYLDTVRIATNIRKTDIYGWGPGSGQHNLLSLFSFFS
jgi:hypothetical protein